MEFLTQESIVPLKMTLSEPCVRDDGIYVSSDIDCSFHKMLISKELFVEAYNKWIKGE